MSSAIPIESSGRRAASLVLDDVGFAGLYRAAAQDLVVFFARRTQLTLHMTTTVDGFIAKADGTLWDAFPWPGEMQEFTNDFFRQVDTAIYGRLTYETIVPWWPNIAMGKRPADVEITEGEIELANLLEGIAKVVFSRTMDAEATDAVVIEGDVVETVMELKRQPGGYVVLHGGAGLVAELAEAGLIDEFMLFVSSAAIGRASHCSQGFSTSFGSGSSKRGFSARPSHCSGTNRPRPRKHT